jgi:hypothetical protein
MRPKQPKRGKIGHVAFKYAKTNKKGHQMARKPNYEFERRERDRLKAIKNAEKAEAKREARERAKAEAGGTPPKDDTPEPA